MSMRAWLRKRRDGDEEESLARGPDEPNPAVALAVGLIYVFRTAAGGRIMRELEGAVRKYAADPQALWRLVRDGEGGQARRRAARSSRAASPSRSSSTSATPK